MCRTRATTWLKGVISMLTTSPVILQVELRMPKPGTFPHAEKEEMLQQNSCSGDSWGLRLPPSEAIVRLSEIR